MPKINLCCLLSCLLLLGTTTKPLVAQRADQPTAAVEVAAATKPAATRQADSQVATVEKVKIKIAKLGVGSKAKATIKLKDGSKIKGYVAQSEEDNFVIRDRKTNAPTTIRYSDVAKVEENRGHSTARNIAIGVGIGVGALLLAIAISIAHLDD
jgi:preprotein translocase subunit SecF